MNLPAAVVALAVAGYGVVLYAVIPGGRQVGVAYWIIAAFGLVLARALRRQAKHGRKRTLRKRKNAPPRPGVNRAGRRG